ncbi:FGGY family carbohydrate kinase, partial [Alteromonas sp. 14N.309.X.WAT.G.H12]|uniref:FGGY family carbohydrate kinase n=1 Tax=Alteromonas sp. 14N.309.X.WAT.G.H12 TaxID=3120824 RepID=UPI002FD4EA6C
PQECRSEQDPEHWWQALDSVLTQLGNEGKLKHIRAIGLAGQMHGAVILDKANKVIRPAILWNDGRSAKQCQTLMTQIPDAKAMTGNLIMPGFTAPKIKWLQEFEPDNFARIHKVLLPKDYLRFLLSGQFVSDMSDAAGTCWLDTGKRAWSNALLNACGLTQDNMPALVEGPHITGQLSEALSHRWHMPQANIVGGAGDNAAGAIGSGIVNPGQAMISLGTSGVIFVVTDTFRCNPDAALHSFC